MANARTPHRIQVAMENGFLNARCVRAPELLRRYGFWCWRMALPIVTIERCSPHSRFCRVRLDLFTTPFQLTVSGQAALIAISARVVPARHGTISAHAAEWTRVPHAAAAELARSVFRAARRPGSYELQRAAPALRPRLVASA
jgi:hypothetical protein